MIDRISFVWGMAAGTILFGIAGSIAYAWAVKNAIVVYHGR